jgi:hypothetical protein
VAIALVYQLTGKIGAAALFGVLPGCICLVLAVRQWRHRGQNRKPLTMTAEAFACIPELLKARQIVTEHFAESPEFEALKCVRSRAVVLLLLAKFPRPKDTGEKNQERYVVTAAVGHLLEFWRIPQDSHLRKEIVELLRQSPARSSGADVGAAANCG